MTKRGLLSVRMATPYICWLLFLFDVTGKVEDYKFRSISTGQ